MTELVFTAETPRLDTQSRFDASWRWRDGAQASPARHVAACASRDAEFVAMLDGYRPSGGLARAGDVMKLLERHGQTGAATLARWNAERSVICFEWQSLRWLPWFQFNRTGMTRVRGLAPVLAELTAICDPWALAHWFVRPTPCLAGRMPVELMLGDPDAVFDAARVERFVATA